MRINNYMLAFYIHLPKQINLKIWYECLKGVWDSRPCWWYVFTVLARI